MKKSVNIQKSIRTVRTNHTLPCHQYDVVQMRRYVGGTFNPSFLWKTQEGGNSAKS